VTVATRPPRVKVADPCTDYARAVVARKIVAGPYVRAACKRHLDDLAAWKRGERGLIWNLAEANRVIALIGAMPLPDGSPFVVQPSQAFIAGSVFGWYLEGGDVRRFRTAFVEEGKGNGKTAFTGRLGIVLVAADGQDAAEVYTAGVTRDQAHYLWNDANLVVKASETLRGIFDIGAHNLGVPSTNSYMRPVSSEARSLDQKRVHAALIDEIHEHATSLVVEKMRAGTKGDERALIFEITNSGYDRHSICWQHHTYSIQVATGVVQNDSWFAYVCALDEGDRWQDEKVWPKANPLLGVTISWRYLREQVQEAQDMPTHAALVQRLNFCIWTEASAGAIEMTRWDLGKEPPQIETGSEVYAAMDLSTTTDLSAFVLMREADDGYLDVVPYFWCPKETITMRSRRDRVPYTLWAEQGYITATEGNVVDYDSIRRKVSGYYVEDGTVKHDDDCLADQFHIREFAYDRWNASQLVTDLMSDGATMVPVGQGYASMSAPTKDWLARIASGKVRHGGNPVFRWMAANLVTTQDPAGNIKPDKAKSMDRIDGHAATITALSRLIAPHEPEPENPAAYWEHLYEQRLAESKGEKP
jgi:phage terminase large subunit-like protein